MSNANVQTRIMPQNTIQSPLSFDTVMYIAVSNTKQINGVHKKLQFKYTLHEKSLEIKLLLSFTMTDCKNEIAYYIQESNQIAGLKESGSGVLC